MNPLIFNKTSFEKVCSDFDQLRTCGHERISIQVNEEERGYLPITVEKSCWVVRFIAWVLRGAWFEPRREADQVVELTFNFFQQHKEFLCGHSSALLKLLELQIDDCALKQKICSLWQEVREKEIRIPLQEEAHRKTQESENAAKELIQQVNEVYTGAQTKALKIIEDAESKAKEKRSAAKEKAKEIVAEALQEKKKVTEELSQAYEVKKQFEINFEAEKKSKQLELERKLEFERKKVKVVQDEIEAIKKVREQLIVPKTLLRCFDVPMVVSTGLLQSIPFFNNCPQFEGGIKPSKEEAEQYPDVKYFIDFKEWGSEILQTYFSIFEAKNKTLPEHVANNRDLLFKIYILANYLQHEWMIEASNNYIQNVSRDDCIHILTSEITLSPNDPLISKAINCAIRNFDQFIADPRFLRVQSEYLAPIISSDQLKVENEAIVWAFVERWIKANKELVSEEVDAVRAHVRFEHLNMPAEELVKRDISVNRPRRLVQTLNVKNNNFDWNLGITAEEFHKSWSQLNTITSEKFVWKDKTWYLQWKRIDHDSITFSLHSTDEMNESFYKVSKPLGFRETYVTDRFKCDFYINNKTVYDYYLRNFSQILEHRPETKAAFRATFSLPSFLGDLPYIAIQLNIKEV